MTASAYRQISAQVAAILSQPITDSRRQSAYMVARAAMLDLMMCYGPEVAAEIAYKLADAFATAKRG